MITQVFIFYLISVAVGSPSMYPEPIYGSPSIPIKEARPQPYSFNYDVKDVYGTTLTRNEHGDELGNKRGSYGYIDANGISRQVDYIADDNGFRAVVKTNEPGTESLNPANVEIISKYQEPSSHGSSSGPVSVPSSRSVPAYDRPTSAVYEAALVNKQLLVPVALAQSSLGAAPINKQLLVPVAPAPSSLRVAPINKQLLVPVAPAPSSLGAAAVNKQLLVPVVPSPSSLRAAPINKQLPIPVYPEPSPLRAVPISKQLLVPGYPVSSNLRAAPISKQLLVPGSSISSTLTVSHINKQLIVPVHSVPSTSTTAPINKQLLAPVSPASSTLRAIPVSYSSIGSKPAISVDKVRLY